MTELVPGRLYRGPGGNLFRCEKVTGSPFPSQLSGMMCQPAYGTWDGVPKSVYLTLEGWEEVWREPVALEGELLSAPLDTVPAWFVLELVKLLTRRDDG